LGAIALLASVFLSARPRSRTQNAAKALLTVAVILAIVHFSGLLKPFYTREGWLLLELDVKIAPTEVRAGDPLTYTLTTTNEGVRAARGRQFVVDGLPHNGVLVYGVLPDLEFTYLTLGGTPAARVFLDSEEEGAQEKVCTVIYANPRELGANPMYWSWSTSYTPGWKVVAAITGDGNQPTDLHIGETFSLQYRVIVPPEHPAGHLHQRRASLSYRDPQWATWTVHDLWFAFEDIVTVLPAAD
jgi:uncharacterized repeat protein (TIGR01451 family)